MSAGVLDVMTPGGTAWWQWLPILVAASTILLALSWVVTTGSSYDYGPGASSIAALAGAIGTSIYILAAATRFYDLRWPQNHLGYAALVPLAWALATFALWLTGELYSLKVVLFVCFVALTVAAAFWWVAEAVEKASRAVAAMGGLSTFVVIGLVLLLWALAERK